MTHAKCNAVSHFPNCYRQTFREITGRKFAFVHCLQVGDHDIKLSFLLLQNPQFLSVFFLYINLYNILVRRLFIELLNHEIPNLFVAIFFIQPAICQTWCPDSLVCFFLLYYELCVRVDWYWKSCKLENDAAIYEGNQSGSAQPPSCREERKGSYYNVSHQLKYICLW